MTTYAPDMETVRITLLDWFKSASGLSRVYWSNQMVRRPTRPYGTLNIINWGNDKGSPYVKTYEEEEQGYQQLVSTNEITVSCQVFTDTTDLNNDALVIMQKVNQSIGSQTLRNILLAENIAVFDCSGITNIDEQLGNRWEKRAQQDYFFRVKPSIIEEIDLIETIALTGTLTGAEESVILDINNE